MREEYKIILFATISIFAVLISHANGYKIGYYEGLDYICDEELLIDDDNNIYCDEIKGTGETTFYINLGGEDDGNKT